MAHTDARSFETLGTKVRKEDPDFVDEVQSMTADQLKDKIVALAQNQEAILDAKDKDTDLASLSEQLKTAKETYSIPLKAIKLKVKYLVEMLAAKGK